MNACHFNIYHLNLFGHLRSTYGALRPSINMNNLYHRFFMITVFFKKAIVWVFIPQTDFSCFFGITLHNWQSVRLMYNISWLIINLISLWKIGKYSYSCPSVSIGDWPQDPSGYPNPQILQSFTESGIACMGSTSHRRNRKIQWGWLCDVTSSLVCITISL